jgi:hypothetical protein
LLVLFHQLSIAYAGCRHGSVGKVPQLFAHPQLHVVRLLGVSLRQSVCRFVTAAPSVLLRVGKRIKETKTHALILLLLHA